MISRIRLSCSKRRHRIGGAELRSAIVAACVKGGASRRRRRRILEVLAFSVVPRAQVFVSCSERRGAGRDC